MFRPQSYLISAVLLLRGAVAQDDGITRRNDTEEDKMRKQMQASLTAFLNANPDFSLPGLPSGRGGRGRGRGGGGLSRGGAGATGLTPAGRYPMEI